MNTRLFNKRLDAKVQPSSWPLFDPEDPNQSREESKVRSESNLRETSKLISKFYGRRHHLKSWNATWRSNSTPGKLQVSPPLGIYIKITIYRQSKPGVLFDKEKRGIPNIDYHNTRDNKIENWTQATNQIY